MKSNSSKFRVLFIIADIFLVVMIAFVALLIVNKFSNDIGYGDVVALNYYKYFEVEAKGKLAFSADEDVLLPMGDAEGLELQSTEKELLKEAGSEGEDDSSVDEDKAKTSEDDLSDITKETGYKDELDKDAESKEEQDINSKEDTDIKSKDKGAKLDGNKASKTEVKKYPCEDVSSWIVSPTTYSGDDKLVFLTFDDGPSLSNTPLILDVLKEEGVGASFFVLGGCATQKHAANTIKREFDEGHSVGLHTFTHEYSFLYPNRVGNLDNILYEIDENIAAIRAHLGDDYKPSIFRYPGGHMSWSSLDETDEALAKRGIHYIDWNVGAGDAVYKDNPAYYRTALENVMLETEALSMPNVVVVLMHDSNPKCVDDLKGIIDYFRDNGYKFGVLE